MPIQQEIRLDENRRDKHDIVMQILSLLKSIKSIRKTKLMAILGLSSLQAKRYLSFLEDNRLVEISKTGISITEKGLDHLERCSQCPMFERSNAIWKFMNVTEISLRLEGKQIESK
jgi:predicted transcriptional regulator